MAEREPTSPDIQEELTAYLDGELDAAAVRQVEDRLARDSEYREELHKLERAWNMLDRLPRAVVDDAFTRTTMEMVALNAAEEAQVVVKQLPQRRRRQRLLAGVSMAAALAIGFFIGRHWWPSANDELLRDLPVLENLDQYYQVNDVDFLRLLDKNGLFAEGDNDHGP